MSICKVLILAMIKMHTLHQAGMTQDQAIDAMSNYDHEAILTVAQIEYSLTPQPEGITEITLYYGCKTSLPPIVRIQR